MDNQKPLSIKELRQITKPIRNVNIEHKENLSALDKTALWVTEHVGSMGFFSIILIWTILWLLWNTIGPAETRFDPYPAFVMWLFISNMIQLFLLPLLLVGQNLQNRRAETRSEIDFEINIKSEKEIETILKHLEYQTEKIEKILEKIEKKK
ncbi:DUF1003 domain-containing protein [Candidatus Wolfebacteria bacterium]|nr:DUF1003 domain-containing protein [Candidatus Wolfebacteria bacterium]